MDLFAPKRDDPDPKFHSISSNILILHLRIYSLVFDSQKPTMKVNRMLLLLAVFDLGFSVEDPFIRMKLGGVCDYIGAQNSVEIDSLARFAAQERNKKEVFSFVFFTFTAPHSPFPSMGVD